MNFIFITIILAYVVYGYSQEFISLKESKIPLYDSSKLKYCEAKSPSVEDYNEIVLISLISIIFL